jgi:L-2-hydroxyglutarate oxidase LhgO
MDSVDIVVIGAGVIGLAVAERLARPGRDVVVLERHDGFGRETSSRNSEVIHAGLYYREELLKTRLCVRGNPLLYEACARAGIPHRRTGKIVVATDDAEAEQLHALHGQAGKNGVRGLELMGRRRMFELEPRITGVLGLYSPESGILDSHGLMGWLERGAEAKGATVAYRCEVTGVRWTGRHYAVEVREADGTQTTLAAPCVVNAAGLHADRVAEMAGIDLLSAGYRIAPCKGEYFKVSGRHRGILSHLVYPTPLPDHLGTHVVLGLDGTLRLGPNAFSVDALEYDVDPGHQTEFYEKARRFLPFLAYDDLSPDQSGIRPRLYRPGEPFRDFVIREESDRGLPGFVDLIGIESPGLTACLAIAEMVEGLLQVRASASTGTLPPSS